MTLTTGLCARISALWNRRPLPTTHTISPCGLRSSPSASFSSPAICDTHLRVTEQLDDRLVTKIGVTKIGEATRLARRKHRLDVLHWNQWHRIFRHCRRVSQEADELVRASPYVVRVRTDLPSAGKASDLATSLMTAACGAGPMTRPLAVNSSHLPHTAVTSADATRIGRFSTHSALVARLGLLSLACLFSPCAVMVESPARCSPTLSATPPAVNSTSVASVSASAIDLR